MPAYNFQKRFVPKILDGSKPHTIRKRRKRPTKVGDMLYLKTGMRTKQCFEIAQAVCVKIEPIVIHVVDKRIEYVVRRDKNSRWYAELSRIQIQELALKDGFEMLDDFFNFFKLYKREVLDDFEIIWWDPKTLTPTLSLQGEGVKAVKDG